MIALIMLLITAWGWSLLCVSQKKYSKQAKNYFAIPTLFISRCLGGVLLFISALALVMAQPGDLGLITWLGWNPCLIIAFAVIAGKHFVTLVYFVRLLPLLIVALLTMFVTF